MPDTDCDCELCGVPATRSLNGTHLCDTCDPFEVDEDVPGHWADEIPSGLLDDEEFEIDGEEYDAAFV